MPSQIPSRRHDKRHTRIQTKPRPPQAMGPASDKQAISVASAAASSCGLAILAILESAVKHNVQKSFIAFESVVTLALSLTVYSMTLKGSDAWRAPYQIIFPASEPVSNPEKPAISEKAPQAEPVPVIKPREPLRKGLLPALKDFQVWLHAILSFTISFPLYSFTTFFLALCIEEFGTGRHQPLSNEVWDPADATHAQLPYAPWSQLMHYSLPISSPDRPHKVAILTTSRADADASQPRSQDTFSPCSSTDLPLLIPIAIISTLATICTHAIVSRQRSRRPPILIASALLPMAGYWSLHVSGPFACASLTLIASSLYTSSALALTWTPHSVEGTSQKKAVAAMLQVGAGVAGGLLGTAVYKLSWGIQGAHLWSIGMLSGSMACAVALWYWLGTEEGSEDREYKDVEM